MECTLYGFDVYSAEVDDKGIDFVIRKDHEKYYDIQVKSALPDAAGSSLLRVCKESDDKLLVCHAERFIRRI